MILATTDATGLARDLIAEGGWSQARLDADYTPRATVSVPAFDAAMARYADLSARARTLTGARCDLRYDPDSDVALDLFGVAPGAKRPVFVFIHGGCWRALSKADSAFMACALAAQGIATAVPDYSLAPRATLSQIVRQMRAAVAWLWHNADSLGLDRSRIVVGGSSAGGHLAAMLAIGGWQSALGLPERCIAGALPVSGLFELAPIAASHVQAWMNLTPDEIATLSPLRHAADHRVPTVVALAEAEPAGFVRQSQAYAGLLGADLVRPPGTNHFDVILDLADPQSRLFDAMLGLFRPAQ